MRSEKLQVSGIVWLTLGYFSPLHLFALFFFKCVMQMFFYLQFLKLLALGYRYCFNITWWTNRKKNSKCSVTGFVRLLRYHRTNNRHKIFCFLIRLPGDKKEGIKQKRKNNRTYVQLLNNDEPGRSFFSCRHAAFI